jgi:hypothetical protein
MESTRATRLHGTYGAAVAFVEVETRTGDFSIGTAFHVGEGVFVTARHVVEGHTIHRVEITEPLPIRGAEMFPELPGSTIDAWETSWAEVLGRTPLWKDWAPPMKLSDGPVLSNNPDSDVAAFRVEAIHPGAGIVLLGVHIDDWVHRNSWVLLDCLVLGYPPIPTTNTPHLVSARAEINAVVQPRHAPNIHFIVSSLPRGGFSGGPVIHEDGYALGLVTSSLTEADKPPETGFMAVLSVEPILDLLRGNGLMPRVQDEWQEYALSPEATKAAAEKVVLNFHKRIRGDDGRVLSSYLQPQGEELRLMQRSG